MKRSNLICTALIVLLPLLSFSQKADRERLGYFNYIQHPASDELADAETYRLLVELEDDDAYRRQRFEEQFQPAGFQSAAIDAEPDFTIKIIERKFDFSSGEKNSYNKKYKTSTGESSKTVYSYDGSVGSHYTIEVMNATGEEIFREDVTNSKSFRGETSDSMTEAFDNFKKKKTQVKEEVLMEELVRINELFDNQFGVVEKTINLNAIRIKEKKHDYPGFNEAFDKINQAYEMLDESPELTEEVTTKLTSVIEFFNEFVKDATPGDKKSKKNADVTAGAYLDLGLANFMMKNYDQAHESFEQARTLDDKVVFEINQLVEISESLAARKALLN